MAASPATALPVESLVGPPAPLRGGSLSRRQGRVGWLFILPSMTGFLVFTLVPLIAGLGIAFTDWNVVSGLSGINLVGLDNFRGLLTDPMFWSSAGRTLFYAGIAVPGTMVGGLLLGLALNLDVPGRAVLRAVFFLPHIVTSIAIGMIWLLLLNPQSGVVNNALRTLGITEPPSWLVSESWSLPSLILIAIWSGVGYCAVIYLAGIQSLPQELYEAAMLDGAGVWRRFRTITWPSLMPTTTFLGVTLVISQSQGFGLINFLTAGGPGTSSTTLSYYMYQEGFQYYRFGYAAAIGVMSFLGVIVVSALLWRYQKGRGLYT